MNLKWMVVVFWALGVLGSGAFGQDGQIESDRFRESLDPGGRSVFDEAGVFSPEQKAELEGRLNAGWEAGQGALVVAVVKSLHGGEIDDFAVKLFQQWGIGEKGKDNGVLLLAAIEDRKVRIEPGYGWEGTLNDARCGRVLDEWIIPRFKEGQYAQGLMAGADALLNIMKGEGAAETATEEGNPVVALVFVVMFILFVLWILVKANRGGRGGGARGSEGSTSSGWSGGSSSGSGGSFGGFSGGSSGGGGASRGW